MGEQIKMSVVATIKSLKPKQRIVVELDNHLCYAGSFVRVATFDELDGVFLRIDETTALSIWCPTQHISDVMVIPLGEET